MIRLFSFYFINFFFTPYFSFLPLCGIKRVLLYDTSHTKNLITGFFSAETDIARVVDLIIKYFLADGVYNKEFHKEFLKFLYMQSI